MAIAYPKYCSGVTTAPETTTDQRMRRTSLETPLTFRVSADVCLINAIVARFSRNATDAFSSSVIPPTFRTGAKVLRDTCDASAQSQAGSSAAAQIGATKYRNAIG